jgi:hypothetical protein
MKKMKDLFEATLFNEAAVSKKAKAALKNFQSAAKRQFDFAKPDFYGNFRYSDNNESWMIPAFTDGGLPVWIMFSYFPGDGEIAYKLFDSNNTSELNAIGVSQTYQDSSPKAAKEMAKDIKDEFEDFDETLNESSALKESPGMRKMWMQAKQGKFKIDDDDLADLSSWIEDTPWNKDAKSDVMSGVKKVNAELKKRGMGDVAIKDKNVIFEAAKLSKKDKEYIKKYGQKAFDELQASRKKVNTAAKRERPGPAKYSYGKQTVENVNLNEAGDYEVAGVKGMKSKPFKKSFKTAEAREKWIEKNEDDIDELRFRDPK